VASKVLFINLVLRDIILSLRKSFFVSIVEDFFTPLLLEKGEINVTMVFFKNKAHVWFDMLKRDHEDYGFSFIKTWKSFNNFFNKFFHVT
jgi:hypothetical protein